MKKILSIAIGSLLIVNIAFATTVSTHTTYTATGQVTDVNLNGNFNNIRSVVNGNLDNDNARTSAGFRFYEVLSSSPSHTEGRLFYDTTNDVLSYSNGSSWLTAVDVATAQTITGAKTYNAALTAASTLAVTGVATFSNYIKVASGLTLPGLHFTSETDCGIGLVSADQWGLFSGGGASPTERCRIDGTNGTLNITNGITLGSLTFTDTKTISPNSNGSGTTTMYIGNNSINVTAPSDKQAKKDIRPIKKSDKVGIDELKKLSVKKFKFNQDVVSDGDIEHTGLIAQEVEAIYPEAVFVRSDELKAIDYQKLIPLIIKSIQDEDERITALEARITALENK